MSSSVEVTFSFSYLSSLEVVLGSGCLAHDFSISANTHKTFSGKEAFDLMQSDRVLSKLSRFDQAIVQLMIVQEEAHEQERIRLLPDADRYEARTDRDIHAGTYLTIRHCR